MAAAAGKRGPKPISYFHDEFATLGSNETPVYAEEKFLGALYGKHREENCLMNSLILPSGFAGNRTIATSVHSKLLSDFREFQPDQERALYIYREFFYREFFIHPHVTDRRNLSDISYEAKRVLAYYAPYLPLLGEFPSGLTKDTAKFLCDTIGFSADMVERTLADYEQLASGEEYEYMGIHQRRMMEEIERAALMVPRERDVSIEDAIRCFITQFPLKFSTIIREFSKTELNQFLIPAVARRTEILHRLALDE